MQTVQELAKETERQFGYITLDSGEKRVVWKGKDERPEWISDMIDKAHMAGFDVPQKDMPFPDDHIYQWIYDALTAYSETDEPDDISIEADVYNHKLLDWVGSHSYRWADANEAMCNWHYHSLSDLFSELQANEKYNVYRTVLDSLRDFCDEDVK